MTIVKTANGTKYTFNNGRIIRDDLETVRSFLGPIQDWPCVTIRRPIQLGDPMSLRIHGVGGIVTSPVTEINHAV